MVGILTISHLLIFCYCPILWIPNISLLVANN